MAESFGADVERYDRARPEYPRDLVDRVVAESPGADVLDVGCGTGIEARQFRAAGCRVLGVDPDARMAAFARRGGIDVEVAAFEDWEPAGRTFDAVVAGQAWHWVDPVAGPAKAARILRPGGLLAVFAHVFQPPAAVAEAFAAACRRVLPGSPFAGESRPASDVYDVMFTGFADAIAKTGGLGAPDRRRFTWERTYTRDEWLDFLPTTGGLTRVPPGVLAEVLAEVGAAIDGLGGSFVLPYTTLAVVARKY
ncbi:class I SAM-dependent methyltransferase [Amycolatopsis vancoresmycina]|uniref:Methyltransferase type 11 n=1 Tax=Amycolatopsis vancoresmycina DSM 44592 TaxID=1292037 RepID=R1FWX7_9PSEU|nr:class I SAM-dependent methyltransferase [Amycolatopsis vancoresmycina]EOD63888.1 methyltransferase type 11 [Amycolatopsis vancoresmycina DSM 44592]